MSKAFEYPKSDLMKGSRPRCQLLTAGRPEQVTDRINKIIEPFGMISVTDEWMPKGLELTEEAQLHNAEQLLPVCPFGEILRDWWLAEYAPVSSTPHWDIASQCTIDGESGLLLVEAKAHQSELKVDDACGSLHRNNCHQIKRAIDEANNDFNTLFHGWHLSHEHHYQLSNRFAWSWKIASLGIPVVLVYLGFLNADEMQDPFTTERSWEQAIRCYGKGVVPDSVWNSKLVINHTPLYVLIRSKEMPLQ